MIARHLALAVGLLLGVAAPLAAWAQSPPATLVQPPPAPTPGTPPAATPGPAAQAPSPDRPTLVAKPGDPADMDEVTLPEKAVLILGGRSTWDAALPNLRAAFARIEAELAKAGIAPAGRPIAMFLQSTDDDFRFDAMIPIAAGPSPPIAPPEMRFGVTPSGKSYRFVHQGAYAEIDTTFDLIATYLQAKDIVPKDAYLEEYVNDIADADDVRLEVNIFVLPK